MDVLGQVKYAVNVNAFTHIDDFDGLMAFVKTAEELGYDKCRFIDHVVGVDVNRQQGMAYTPYTHHSRFNEVFTLLAYLCAFTSRIKLVTGVLNLPQRQTALVAKQAAQVDVLSNGRMLLACGLGYNEPEYKAMEVDIKKRGRRFEEQIDVLRMLWSGQTVEFRGDFHDLEFVNINPPPVNGTIPIWIGAGRTEDPVPPDKVLERIGRKADGWCPLFRIADGATTLDERAREAIAKVSDFAAAAGRDPKTIDLELGLYPEGKSRDQIAEEVGNLHALGAGHIHCRFVGKSGQEQIEALHWFMDTIA